MVEIAPFRGWRYNPELAGDLAGLIAPPYDIISPAQQEQLYARSPYNVIRLELTAAEPSDPQGAAGEVVRHARARATLDSWQATGILQQDQQPALYLYRQEFTFGGRRCSRRCLLAAVRLYPWAAGKILPHEHTLARPKAERLALLRATHTNISPIWSLYEDHQDQVAALLDAVEAGAPISTVADEEGLGHSLWLISGDHAPAQIVRALAGGPLFIADGHHRYETALMYQQEVLSAEVPGADLVLMALTATDDPGLIVLPTHRLIANLPPERLASLSGSLAERFSVEELSLPPRAMDLQSLLSDRLPGRGSAPAEHRFMLLGPEPERLRLLRVRERAAAGPAPSPALQGLDVWLAHALILEQGLGIDAASLERQEHLSYTRDPQEAVAAVRNGACQLALFLPPTPVSQLLAVAREGGVMPQKSTYFYPKPATGLVLRQLQ